MEIIVKHLFTNLYKLCNDFVSIFRHAIHLLVMMLVMTILKRRTCILFQHKENRNGRETVVAAARTAAFQFQRGTAVAAARTVIAC